MCRAGYIHFDLSDSKLSNKEGTPQGSIISPLLCNIVLHELDLHMLKLRDKLRVVGKKKLTDAFNANRRFTNNEWEPIYKAIKSQVSIAPASIRRNLNIIRKEDAIHKNIKAEFLEGNKRMEYVRYADDTLIGWIGSKHEAYQILCEFVNVADVVLKMGVNFDKTNVHHHEKGALFLGYRIQGNYGLNVKKVRNNDGTIKQRVGDVALKFGVPLLQLMKKYVDKGFLQKSKNTANNVRLVRRRQDKWLFLKHD